MTRREYIIARLDYVVDISTCIINYFKKHDKMSFDLARSTFEIIDLQLKQIYKEHYEYIAADDSLCVYYEDAISNMEFIKHNLAGDNVNDPFADLPAMYRVI